MVIGMKVCLKNNAWQFKNDIKGDKYIMGLKVLSIGDNENKGYMLVNLKMMDVLKKANTRMIS